MADNSKNLDDIAIPQLEETTYDPSAHRSNRSLDNIQAPQLDDTAYVPTKKTSSLSDVAVPVLSDTLEASGSVPQYTQYGSSQTSTSYQAQNITPQFTQYGGAKAQNPGPQFTQYGSTQTQNQGPQFTQYGSAQAQNPGPQFTQYGSSQAQNPGPQFTQYGSAQAQNPGPQFTQYGSSQAQNPGPQFSDNGSAQPQNPGPQFTQYGSSQAQNQGSQFTQYGSTQAQGISEQNNTVNMKSQKSVTDTGLGDIAPPQLEDEPPVNQRYVPRYADPDLEAAKKQSVDRAIKGSISAANESLDKEKSLAAYRDFMREKESDMAKKGAKAVVFLMIGTLISGLITFLYTSFAMKSGCPDVLGSINSFYIAVGIAQLLAGGLMLAPTKSTQKASSTILTLATIVHVIPGVIVMLNKQNIKIAVILYLAVLILNIAVCFTLGSNENIKKHYNGHEID